MKPRILISRSQNNIAEFYVSAITAAGGIADTAYAPESTDGYDGLLLAGGGDIDPSYYGETVQDSMEIDAFRDEREMRLCESFIKEGKPILGICRGHQLLNVYFGGALVQHLKNADEHREENGSRIHKTRTVNGSLMFRLFGKYPVVNSIHHQAVKTLGKGLIATQFCDDVVEAFEHESLPVIGVQWHPERICLDKKRDDAVDALPLFEYFISMLV